MFLYESSRITVENCLFEDNSADDGGGGLHVRYCSPFIKNCVFRQNSAVNGAGIHFSGSSSSLEYCLFENNSATYGGAMYFDACSPNILNCTISENSASSNGGAIVLYDYSYPEFVNCILWNDSPNEIHSLVEGGEPTFSYSDIQGSWSGTGNINSNPLFVNPANCDFRLSTGSPCIDSGDPSSPLDPDGTRCDMGAYYFNQNSLATPSNVTINYSSGNVTISWDAVAGATSYNVYSSTNPYSDFSLEQSGITETNWSETVSENKKFYYITAEN